MRGWGLDAQLVGNDPRLYLFNAAGRNITQQKRPVGNADQPANMMAKMFHDPAYFAVLAFADCDCHPGIAGHLAVQPRADLSIAHTINGYAIGNAGKGGGIHAALHPHPVFSAPSGAWQLQMPGQPTIIRQQDQPFGIHVQPANRQDARQSVCQRIENGLTVFLVAVRHHQPAWLVIAPQPRRLARWQWLAINGDLIRGGDIQCRAGNHIAVHSYAPIKNARFCLAARTDTGAGDMFGDACWCAAAVEAESGFV